jgi:putative membrane protein
MSLIANVLVALVAALHVYFLVLEMFSGPSRKGSRPSATPSKKHKPQRCSPPTRVFIMAFAAGLIWGLLHPNPVFGFQIKVFFLLCVIVAGLYGGYSVSRKIIMVQALPAAAALILLCLTH